MPQPNLHNDLLSVNQVLTLERSVIQLERSPLQAEVLILLDSLPEDLIAEVRDFAAFLQHKRRYD